MSGTDITNIIPGLLTLFTGLLTRFRFVLFDRDCDALWERSFDMDRRLYDAGTSFHEGMINSSGCSLSFYHLVGR